MMRLRPYPVQYQPASEHTRASFAERMAERMRHAKAIGQSRTRLEPCPWCLHGNSSQCIACAGKGYFVTDQQ